MVTRAFGPFSFLQADTQQMPKVDDYIAQKAEVYRLKQETSNWERKVNNSSLTILGHRREGAVHLESTKEMNHCGETQDPRV